MKVHDRDELTDEELISELGIDQAFQIIFNRRLNEIYSYCFRRLSAINYYDIESVAVEIFERAWEARDGYKGYYLKDGTKKDAKIKNWLYQIAHNHCYDIHAKLNPQFVNIEYVEHPSYKRPNIPLRIVLKEFKEFLKQKIGKAKLVRYYKVFYLKFVVGYTYEETALRCHINPNTTRQIGMMLKRYYREFGLI